MTHGTRPTYQAGCRCEPCKQAEAVYRARLRACHRAGRLPLGHYLPATEAACLVQAFLRERFMKGQLAPRLGLERHTLCLAARQMIRLKTLLKLRRGYRILLTDTVFREGPNV